MRTPGLLLGAGLACFLVFSIAMVPAQVLTDLSETDDLKFIGVTGTAWSGQVRNINTPALQIDRTVWSLQPLSLLRGRLAGTIETQWAGGTARGDLSVGIGGSVSVRNLEASGSLAPITRFMNLPVTGGRFAVNLTNIEIADGWPRMIAGEVRIGELPLTLAGIGTGPEGSYAVSFTAEEVPEDGFITGVLTDLDGPLEIDGVVILGPPSNYDISARIKARPEAPTDIVNALALLGPVGVDGAREFSVAGSM
jgi:hypothetical protein